MVPVTKKKPYRTQEELINEAYKANVAWILCTLKTVPWNILDLTNENSDERNNLCYQTGFKNKMMSHKPSNTFDLSDTEVTHFKMSCDLFP